MNDQFTFTYNKERDEWHVKILGIGYYMSRKTMEDLYFRIGAELEGTLLQKQLHEIHESERPIVEK